MHWPSATRLRKIPATALGALDHWYGAVEALSEDCLFLNVWTAGLDTARRPVMVWLHGGGWYNCAGTAPGFDGTALARDGGVVLVTINHRLNVFGYLALDAADERFADSGNAGTLDMVAALRWVRDNAAAFGGDPGNVTIFGQSGGASKVTALMGMPARRACSIAPLSKDAPAACGCADRRRPRGKAKPWPKAFPLKSLMAQPCRQFRWTNCWRRRFGLRPLFGPFWMVAVSWPIPSTPPRLRWHRTSR